MLKIKKLLPANYTDCYEIISTFLEDNNYFKALGWTLSQFKKQLLEDNNFSLALFDDNFIKSFIIGNIISVEKITEYEILLIYVNINNRKLGYASKLLNKIPLFLNDIHLNKIYLEVSSDNLAAIKLYKNNNFTQTGIRKNYYQFSNKKFDALFFEKTYK